MHEDGENRAHMLVCQTTAIVISPMLLKTVWGDVTVEWNYASVLSLTRIHSALCIAQLILIVLNMSWDNCFVLR